MALDEPSNDDTTIEQGDYKITFDTQTKDVVSQSGGLTIDYVDEANQKGYMLKLNNAGGGGCGDGEGGGCSGCG